MADETDAEVLTAAEIVCSLRDADLAGWTPPWCKPAPSQEVELIWPAVVRGKRSRRRSPSAGSAGTGSGKGRWGRGSPASPLDYSGGSGSGASTSGGEDGGFCLPATKYHRSVIFLCFVCCFLRFCVRDCVGLGLMYVAVGSIGHPQLTFSTPISKPTGQRPRKKLKLPEVQQLVRSLEMENESMRELDLPWLCAQEMRALQRACNALSKENDTLETRFERLKSCNENTSKEQKGKQQVDQQTVVQSPQDSFVLPDLNLPPQDPADVSPVH
ncbi:hypothetical protein EJB05_51366 [Eragrostis curvula]|uniref:Uncharacterized protein n=1 Tax=Eragrostis curvula TaxID=38414 RepID=A0A5J9SVQ4_9POAL|nr:hypothetical protein EJB05_51366 [Eragrostis curvula]